MLLFLLLTVIVLNLRLYGPWRPPPPAYPPPGGPLPPPVERIRYGGFGAIALYVATLVGILCLIGGFSS